MNPVQGKVLSISAPDDARRASLEVDATSACPRCLAGKGCGAGVFGASRAGHHVEALVAPGISLREGQRVRVELEAGNVLLAAAIAYGLPLAGALLGALLAWSTGSGDAVAAVLAVAGLVAGISAGRWHLARRRCLRHFTPVVTGILSDAD